MGHSVCVVYTLNPKNQKDYHGGNRNIYNGGTVIPKCSFVIPQSKDQKIYTIKYIIENKPKDKRDKCKKYLKEYVLR